MLTLIVNQICEEITVACQENVIITVNEIAEPITLTIDEISGGGVVTNECFLCAPELSDESDAVYFYFGWENIGGMWRIQRQERTTGITTETSTGFANLTEAWTNRNTLVYG